MARPPKDVFATDEEKSELFVLVTYSGIDPLVVVCDGLSVTFFGKGKKRKAYLSARETAEWHEEEHRKTSGRSGDLEVAKVLREKLGRFMELKMAEGA